MTRLDSLNRVITQQQLLKTVNFYTFYLPVIFLPLFSIIFCAEMSLLSFTVRNELPIWPTSSEVNINKTVAVTS